MTLPPERKKALRSEARALEPILRIGKQGVTENTIKELKQHLKRRKLIKIKLLKAAIEGRGKKELAQEIADHTGAELVDLVGFVAVLYKASSRK